MFSCFDGRRRDCKDIKPLFDFSSLESCDFSFRNDGNPLLQIEVEPTSDVSLLSIPSLPFPFYLEWSVQTQVFKGDIPARISALPIDSTLTWESNVLAKVSSSCQERKPGWTGGSHGLGLDTPGL